MTIESEKTHESFMAHAIKLARRAWGHTHPNPMVGAVIVEDGQIVAEGWHRAAGQAHAEVEALSCLGEQPKSDTTLYVTLEPCSTRGRTDACTDAIIESGIKKVVVGAVDPNPEHAECGFEILRDAGVEVISGILGDECADLNLIFNHWIGKKEPFLAAKLAMTLDGKFAAASGHSQWVTSQEARDDVMEWRRYFPAIAVGANTVIHDDPSLTSRIDGTVFCPWRFIIDRHLKTASLDRAFRVFSDKFKENTVVLCLQSADDALKEKLERIGVGVWELPEDNGYISWKAFRARCSEERIVGVYLEAGPSLATELIESRRVDYLFIYKAPKFIADSGSQGIGSNRMTTEMGQAIRLEEVRHEIFGADILTRGKLPK